MNATETHWNLRACTSPLRMAKRRFDSSVSRAELTLKRGSFLHPVCLEECRSGGQQARAVPTCIPASLVRTAAHPGDIASMQGIVDGM
jgi:hypothetical protein